MACVEIVDREESNFCFACNTQDFVFGPIMWVPDDHDIDEVISEFRESLGKDPRKFEDSELSAKWYEFSEKQFN